MDSAGKKAGKGPLIAEEISNTLGTSQDQYLFQAVGVDRYNQTTTGNVIPTLKTPNGGDDIPCVVCYSFDSMASNSMKSKNPHSGCRAVEVAKCLDTSDTNPSKNQGGIAVVQWKEE